MHPGIQLVLLTLSILRSFICKTRSSTGLRVISASENKLKSPNTAEEYSLCPKETDVRRWDIFAESYFSNKGLKSWPVAVARLRPAGSTCPLIGRGLRYPHDLEGGDAGHTVVEAFLHPSAVDHVLDPGDCQRRLRHVGGHHAQTGPWWRRPEDLHKRHKHMQFISLLQAGPLGWPAGLLFSVLGANLNDWSHLGLLLWCQQRVQRENIKGDGWVGLLLCRVKNKTKQNCNQATHAKLIHQA